MSGVGFRETTLTRSFSWGMESVWSMGLRLWGLEFRGSALGIPPSRWTSPKLPNFASTAVQISRFSSCSASCNERLPSEGTVMELRAFV